MNNPHDAPEISPLRKGGRTKEFLKETGREVSRELVREAGATLRWTLRGGIVCGVLLGGLGLILMGWPGFGFGFLVGAVFGGLLTAVLYLTISSITSLLR